MSLLAFIPMIEKVLDMVIPDPVKKAEAQFKLLELKQQGELAVLDGEVKLALGQIGINQEEAKNTNWFVAGWRPFVGWTCGVGLAYQFLMQPVLTWVSLNAHWTPPPNLDTGTLTTVLLGMLGLGGIRMYEKLQGKARNT